MNMCIQGADLSCWRKPDAVLVQAPLRPQYSWWQVARLLAAVPFYLTAMAVLFIAIVVIETGNRISGRRWIPTFQVRKRQP